MQKLLVKAARMEDHQRACSLPHCRGFLWREAVSTEVRIYTESGALHIRKWEEWNGVSYTYHGEIYHNKGNDVFRLETVAGHSNYDRAVAIYEAVNTNV
jgi:hypothetical protein